MTGYGRAEEEQDGQRVTAEVRSVNHRFLEVNVKTTGRVFQLDDFVKKSIKKRFTRGYFDVFIAIASTDCESASVGVNEPLLSGFLKTAAELAEKHGVEYPPTLNELLQVKDLFIISTPEWDLDKIKPVLSAALGNALDQVEQMRGIEGAGAIEDVANRLERISRLMVRIDENHAASSRERFAKLKSRVLALVEESGLDEARMMQEAALLADRSDISEELDRLRSHLAQIESLLSEGGPIGRKLEFFVQEVNREANTIGSKTSSAEATADVVEIKSELEKVREQAQNIE